MKRFKGYGVALAASAVIASAALTTAGTAAAAPTPAQPNPVSHATTQQVPDSMPDQPSGLNREERDAVAASHHHRLQRLHQRSHRQHRR